MAVYIFFVSSLMGRQFLNPEKKLPGHEVGLLKFYHSRKTVYYTMRQITIIIWYYSQLYVFGYYIQRLLNLLCFFLFSIKPFNTCFFTKSMKLEPRNKCTLLNGIFTNNLAVYFLQQPSYSHFPLSLLTDSWTN